MAPSTRTPSGNQLPGTQHWTCEMESRLFGDGKCCFHALGNSMVNAGVDNLPGFTSNSRNLKQAVIQLMVTEIQTNADTRKAMNEGQARWATHQMATIDAFLDQVTNKDSANAWFGNYHVQILATALHRMMNHRVIVYTKHLNRCEHILPGRLGKLNAYTDGGVVRVIPPITVGPHDIVVVHSGSHWSATRYHGNISRAANILADEEDENNGTAADPPSPWGAFALRNLEELTMDMELLDDDITRTMELLAGDHGNDENEEPPVVESVQQRRRR